MADVNIQIEQSINKLKSVLEGFAGSEDEHDQKRASLLAYWIKTYSDYIKSEDEFRPEHLIKYKQRDIVQVNFGYRIGSEIGGPHFAVVLNQKDFKNSDTLTVLPLTSLKQNFKESKYKVPLNNGIYWLALEKFAGIIHSENKHIKNIIKELDALKAKGITDEKDFPPELLNSINEAHKTASSFRVYDKELDRLKDGTVAELGQITTISKQRIIRPKSTKDYFYGLCITEDDFNLIKTGIDELIF